MTGGNVTWNQGRLVLVTLARSRQKFYDGTMCLIVFAIDRHERYPLIIAANRDEFYRRPTAPAEFWREAPHLLAGRDLQLGGTWLGITRAGRFAALTNYRDPRREGDDRRSRGVLVRDYLLGTADPQTFLEVLALDDERIKGFNLLIGDIGRLCYHSNCGAPPQTLDGGIYGLSNHLLDTPWPKVTRSKKALAALLAKDTVSEEALFALLADTTIAPDALLPDTGIGQAMERVLSAPFIRSADYGTRSSTVLLVEADGQVSFTERSFLPGEGPKAYQEARFSFRLKP